ncbi:hypothetical protein F4808DRAFT_80805 [Astrocystis sublimbata]|nr:hypothetical protein F4808DRAFT_80805 [Astrocystis sublimbata]
MSDRTVVAKVDGKLWDSDRPLERSCQLELLHFNLPEGKQVFWHSSIHILGEASEPLRSFVPTSSRKGSPSSVLFLLSPTSKYAKKFDSVCLPIPIWNGKACLFYRFKNMCGYDLVLNQATNAPPGL